MAAPDFTLDKIKRPFVSVTTPLVVPFTDTFAPMIGTPVSSFTSPLIVLCWASACEEKSTKSTSTKNCVIRLIFDCFSININNVEQISFTEIL